MEYIQCSHCHKRYRVNDQVRAAAGRMVTCKDCGNPTEIIILEEPDPIGKKKPAAQESSPTKKQPTPLKKEEARGASQAEKHDSQAHAVDSTPERAEKSHRKITLSALLGVCIVAASIYGFYQGRSPTLPNESATASNQSAEFQPRPTVSPMQAIESNPKTNDPALITAENPKGYSTACKEIAANQWILDYSISHGTPQGDEYMRMLERGVNNSAAIRTSCGGSRVVAEVLQTAKEGVPPEWLVQQINDITQANHGDIPRF